MASDKLSIKNLLFTKALPNYVPDSTVQVTPNHKPFICTDCGDKFIFESSYNMHINRKSVKITYMCRHCGQMKTFLNRCKLLSHIRSHSFKTATINVSDLNIEPLPLEYFTLPPSIAVTDDTENNQNINKSSQKSKNSCPECNKDIDSTGITYQDRANHYMQVSDNMTCYSCPICLFSLPTTCALRAHLRIHLGKPPFYCPECGAHIPQKGTIYPYTHDCEGFKTMRATTRLKCKKKNCTNFHPNDYKKHMKTHIINIFKCSTCPATWAVEPAKGHLACQLQNLEGKIIKTIKCPICPNKILSSAKLERHLNGHFNGSINILDSQVYPCRLCNDVFNQVHHLLAHHMKKHGASRKILESLLLDKNLKNKEIFVVVKRCERCLRNFKYKCPFDQIQKLPNECPYRCTSVKIKCFVCKMPITAHWDNIKKHCSALHKDYKCIDIKVNLRKLDMNKIKTKAIPKFTKKKFKSALNLNAVKETHQNVYDKLITIEGKTEEKFKCYICKMHFESKTDLETHLVSHRDLGLAYQCLECGQSFAVKPSFSTHLLLVHQINNADDYILNKHCFNELAFMKNQNITEAIDEGPLQENQCSVCREQFDDSNSLEKHFRVHGMAFLMGNTLKSPH